MKSRPYLYWWLCHINFESRWCGEISRSCQNFPPITVLVNLTRLAKHNPAVLITWPFHQLTFPIQKWLGHQIKSLNKGNRHFSTRQCNGFIKFLSSISAVRCSLVPPFPLSHLHLAPAMPTMLLHTVWLRVNFDCGILSQERSRTIGKGFLRWTRQP